MAGAGLAEKGFKAEKEREAGQRGKVPPNPATVARPRHKQQVRPLSDRLSLKRLCLTLLGLKLEPTPESLEGFSPHSWLGPTPRVPESLGLAWGSGVCSVPKSPGSAPALGTIL